MSKINESTIRDFYRSARDEAVEYFEKYVFPDWSECRSLYANTYDFANKETWQSKMKEPVADNLVHRLSNFLARLLIDTQNGYFTVTHPEKLREDGYKQILSAILDDNNFPQVFADALTWGLITSISVLKVIYQIDEVTIPVYDSEKDSLDTKREIEGRVKIIPVNPFNIRIDPVRMNYVIEEEIISYSEFLDMARKFKFVNVNQITPDNSLSASFRKDILHPVRSKVVVLHHVYTKYLVDSQNNVIDRNIYFLIANGQHVVFYAKNYLPNGRFPYVIGQPVKSLVGVYGRGYLSRIKDVIKNYLDLLNLIQDAFHLSVLGVYEYDVSSIVNEGKHQFTRSIKPMTFYPVTKPNSIRQVYNPVNPVTAVQFLFVLDRILQNRSYQTEFFMGMPTVKGRPTASEVSMKLQESMRTLTDTASNIENSIIQPVLELALMTELIYQDNRFHVDYSESINSPEAYMHVKSLSFSERMNDLRKLKVRVYGLSGRLKKMTSFEKIISILNVLGNMPTVIQAIDGKKLVEKIFSSVEESPEEIFNMSAFDNVSSEALQQLLTGGVINE
jgi:hypothetical protein